MTKNKNIELKWADIFVLLWTPVTYLHVEFHQWENKI